MINTNFNFKSLLVCRVLMKKQYFYANSALMTHNCLLYYISHLNFLNCPWKIVLTPTQRGLLLLPAFNSIVELWMSLLLKTHANKSLHYAPSAKNNIRVDWNLFGIFITRIERRIPTVSRFQRAMDITADPPLSTQHLSINKKLFVSHCKTKITLKFIYQIASPSWMLEPVFREANERHMV